MQKKQVLQMKQLINKILVTLFLTIIIVNIKSQQKKIDLSDCLSSQQYLDFRVALRTFMNIEDRLPQEPEYFFNILKGEKSIFTDVLNCVPYNDLYFRTFNDSLYLIWKGEDHLISEEKTIRFLPLSLNDNSKTSDYWIFGEPIDYCKLPAHIIINDNKSYNKYINDTIFSVLEMTLEKCKSNVMFYSGKFRNTIKLEIINDNEKNKILCENKVLNSYFIHYLKEVLNIITIPNSIDKIEVTICIFESFLKPFNGSLEKENGG